jgi:hypothetical protein
VARRHLGTVTIGNNSFKCGSTLLNVGLIYDLGSSGTGWRRAHTKGIRVHRESIIAYFGLNNGGRRVTNVAAPRENSDAATKGYVDSLVVSASRVSLDTSCVQPHAAWLPSRLFLGASPSLPPAGSGCPFGPKF